MCIRDSEVDVRWSSGALTEGTLRTGPAGVLRVRTATPIRIERDGRPIEVRQLEPGVLAFDASAGATYRLLPR